MASKTKTHHNKRDQKTAPHSQYKRHDVFWAKAKDDGYAARSVYKLEELDKANKLLFPGARVMDLGCAPGSWLQYAAKRVGAQGRVLGIDLEVVTLALPPNVITLVMDMDKVRREKLPSDCFPVDVILSDLAPHTTGIRSVDQARAFDLSARAVLMSDTALKPGGAVLVKTFQGPDTRRLQEGVRARFESAEVARPKATRDGSFEVYVLGKGYRGPPPPEKDPLAVL